MITGAGSVVKCLEHAGVKTVFGMPGAHLLELIDSLIDSPIRSILTTSEQAAVFMADGYARATGTVGVCIAIPGPGLTNMITGLAESLVDSSPLVIFVVGIEKSRMAFHLHEIDQLAIVKPVVKKIITIAKGIEIPNSVANAFYCAEEGEPGPVVVEIPRRLLREETEYLPCLKVFNKDACKTTHDAIVQITDLLTQARLCGIYAGKGALAASHQVIQIAKMLSAPVATTISGKGVIPEDHELSVGFGFGPSGSPVAEKIFSRCDVVLALGCKFSEMSTGKWFMKIPPTLIHIDKNSSVFNKNYPAAFTLCDDVGHAVEQLMQSLKETKREKNLDLIKTIDKEKNKSIEKKLIKSSKNGVHPSQFFFHLRKTVSRDTVMVTDCGNHQLWAISDWPVFAPRTFISPSDYQAMGFGVPAAIGAGIGCKDRRIVCICGDGGFLMSGFEMLTAVRENLRLAVIIFNDQALGLIKIMQKKIFGRTALVDFESPDYRSLAQAIKADYIEINSEEELRDGLQKMEVIQKTVLVNVKVEYKEWPRYVAGVAQASWEKLSLSEKLKLINNRAKRMLKYHQ